MQVSTQEIPFREESSLSLAPLAQGSSVKLTDAAPFDVSSLKPGSNLLDVSNRFGFFVAAAASASTAPGPGFSLSASSKVKGAFTRNEAAVLPANDAIHVQTQSQVAFLKFAYADLYVVAVLDNGAVLVYSLKQLAQGQTAALRTYQLPSPAVDLLPNPSDKPELLAVLLTTGQLAMFDLTSPSSTSPLLSGSGIVSASWSIKGKQIVCGRSDASLLQLAPDGSEKGSVPAPTDLEEPHQTVDVRWLENDIFFVTCAPVNAPTDGLPPMIVNYIILRTKTSLTYCRLIDDPTQPFGTHENRPSRRFVAHLRGVGSFKHLLVLTASNSPDVALLACDAANGSWAVLEVDDNARASLPTTSSGDNTCPFGLALDLTPSPTNETPCLVTYTSEASMTAWAFRSNSADLKSCMVQTQDLASAPDQPVISSQPTAGAPTQPTPSTPAAKPFGSSAVPAFSGKPSFGQSTFGQSGFGSPSAFGTTKSSPAPAAASSSGAFGGFSGGASTAGGGAFGGFAASTAQSGKPAGFGSFGASSSSTNIFGNASSSSSPAPAFGSSTFGASSTNKAAPAFGSGFQARGSAMGEDEDDEAPRPSAPAKAPGLEEMDADELEPQAKGDASASLGFGGGFGLSGGASNPPASAKPNPMFGGFGTNPASTTSAPSQPAASGFAGFGQSSTGFGSAPTSAAPTTSPFAGFGQPAFGASAQPTTASPAASTTTTSTAAPASSAFAGFGKPAFGASTAPATSSPTVTSSPAPSAFSGFGKPSFGSPTTTAASNTSAPAAAAPSAFSSFGKPAFGDASKPGASTAPASTPATSAFSGFGKPAFGASSQASTTPSATSTSTPAATSAAPSAFSAFGQTKTPSFSFGAAPTTSTAQVPATTSSAATEAKPSAFAGFGSALSSGFGAPAPASSPSVSEEKKPSAFSGFGKPSSTSEPASQDQEKAPASSPFAGFGKPSFSFGAATSSTPPSSTAPASESKAEPPKFSFASTSSSPLATKAEPSQEKEEKEEDAGSSSSVEQEPSEQEGSVASENKEDDEASAPSEPEAEETVAEEPESKETEPSAQSTTPAQPETPNTPATPAEAPKAEEKASPFKFPPAAAPATTQSKPAFSFGSSPFGFGGASAAATDKPSSASSQAESAKPAAPAPPAPSFSFGKPSASQVSEKAPEPAAKSPFSFGFGKPAEAPQEAKPAPAPFTFGQSKEHGSSKANEKVPSTIDVKTPSPANQDKNLSQPLAAKPEPSSTPVAGPSTPKTTQPEKSKQEIQAEGLGAEFLKLINLTDQDLNKLQRQAEEKLAMLAQHKEPLQPVGGFPNSFDDGEWTMGDLPHLDEVSTQLVTVLEEVKTAQKKEHSGLLDLQNSCVKAQLKCAEIQRFKDNMANPEFHRQLKAQELGPEQAEMQDQLRSLTTTTQDTLTELEKQVEHVQHRMVQLKAGKAPLRVSSLEMIHQTMRNLSLSINAKLSELTELSTRVDMLTRPHGRSRGNQHRALPAVEDSLFKKAVSEENVAQLKEQMRVKLSLRDVYITSKTKPRLNRSAAALSDKQ